MCSSFMTQSMTRSSVRHNRLVQLTRVGEALVVENLLDRFRHGKNVTGCDTADPDYTLIEKKDCVEMYVKVNGEEETTEGIAVLAK